MDHEDYKYTDLDFRVISHGNGACMPLLVNQNPPAINPASSDCVVDSENDQRDDKSVCTGFYDRDSAHAVMKSESMNAGTIRDSLDHEAAAALAAVCDVQMQPAVGDQIRQLPAVSRDTDQDTSEYSNLPLHDGNCDNVVAVEVNAVLVEMPNMAGSNMISHSPPPPYTLVRGRRMRFFPQQIHLPPVPDPACSYSHVLQHYPDFFQRHASRHMETSKSCCNFLMMTGTLNVRWFIVVISFIALCCVVVGIVLGALKGANEFTGDDSLTISLLLIGVGIILLTVSGIAWRLTNNQAGSDTSSLRRILGLGSVRATSPALQSFRRAPSGPFAAYVLRNSFGRRGGCPPASAAPAPGYCYEFQFRPPPPSYYASMADYRVRTLLDRTECHGNTRTPPPGYRQPIDRSNPLPLLNQLQPQQLATMATLRPLQHHPASAPPSYRSGSEERRSGRERRSLQHVNAIFNENYASAIVYEDEGVRLSRYNINGESRGRLYDSAEFSPPKAGLGSSIELLAQL
ncbi:uncharacterized protein LOC129583644 [Paramacrobiotus metropolitanus]|uniref:uncharacterized protein LOC129583644 n=1 Tax=Paramacrobiotus metropolitanus TaxID=2943436 RepID=UPI00244645D0|nr:uncharacterized protein LOC129583644 [Paramacrobiotus metropolitanus]